MQEPDKKNDSQKVSDEYVKRAYEKWKQDDQLKETQKQNEKKEKGKD